MKSLILLTATVAALCAAEGADAYNSSLRLTLTGMPDEAEMEATLRNTDTDVEASTNGTAEWNEGGSRLSISMFHNNGEAVAFNFGFGVAFTGFADSDDGLDSKLSEFGVALEPGVACNFNTRFALELGVPLGIGVANFTQDDSGFSVEADGTYYEYGVVVRPVLKMNRLVAFIELGWIGNYAEVNASEVNGASNVEMDMNLDSTGTFVSLGAGVAF